MSFSADLILPFPGYRSLEIDGRIRRGRPELYSSIEHFYQSERFRGKDEGLRRAIMNAATAKEARKLAHRHLEHTRDDWHSRHERIMESGIWMSLREHPRHAREIIKGGADALPPYPFRDHHWGNDRAGISNNRWHALIESIRSRLSQATVRILVTGSPQMSNRFVLGSKLESLLRRVHPDVFLIGCGKGTDELVELWCMERSMPVRHFAYKGRRSKTERERHHRALINAATHVIVFSQDDRDSVRFIELASERGRPARVVKLDQSGGLLRTGRPPGSAHRSASAPVR